MENINCVICNKDNTEKVLTDRDLRYNTSGEIFKLVRCRMCGLVFTNPRPNKEEISNYYPDNYRTMETLKSFQRIERRMKKYKSKKIFIFINPWYVDLAEGTTVLDIGCGAGEFLLRLKEMGCIAFGVDMNPITSQYLRERMNLNVITCDIDNGTPFKDNFFDFAVMRHSLEHVYNPVNVLKEVRRILKPKGTLLIGIPNIDSAVSKITRKNWGSLDIPRHLFHFTPKTISILLSKVGFSVENIHHEFKVSRDSLRKWMTKLPLPFSNIPKPVVVLMKITFSILKMGEWIVVKAKKMP